MTFLATPYGKPYTAAGFDNKFRQWCNEADLPQSSSHGLRKATATRLAGRGASADEIMSITGHRSLSEVERYTKEANKPKLADSSNGQVQMKNIRCPTGNLSGTNCAKPPVFQRRFFAVVADAVAFEPVSTLKFPANREKNREFHRIHALGAILKADTRANSDACSEIPYATEQGIIWKEQGILLHEQRIFLIKPEIIAGYEF